MAKSVLPSFGSSSINLDGKSILITGGTGSFGRRFVQTALERFKPERLAIYSRDEFKQYEMQQEFPGSRYGCMRYFIGDVRDRDRVAMAMRGVDIVIHAAAMKHVPAAEYNPFECVHTNIIGAENIVCAAIQAKVQRVIALSTDKAASPINLYGATKLASDKIFIAGNNMVGDAGTRFAVVRYGNVVGSRGSVVPFFKKLVDEGAASLPITDPRMTRFWITLRQGVDFVLSSLETMTGGEIFIPKIPSMRVVDLATAVAPGLKQEVVGIRPGEKLHEAMITMDDARSTVELPDRYVIQPSFAFWSQQGGPGPEAKPVAEDFVYTSDANTMWLNAEQLRRVLEEA